MDIFYNVTRQCRVDEDNCRLAGNPVLYFGACPEWVLHLYTGEPGETPGTLDVSSIPAFRAAVDVDWTTSTEPMCRTVSGIDVSQAEDGVITVPLDANTVRFGQVLNGARSKDAYFELRGLDTNGDVALLILFPVTCHNVIDPDGGEPPEDTPSGYATEAYVDAVVSRKLYLQFSSDGYAWHDTFAEGDVLERLKHGSTGEWSAPFPIPYGAPGKDGTLIGSAVDVTELDEYNSIAFSGFTVPAGVKAPSGNFYPVEKRCVEFTSGGNVVLNFDAFLAYENAASFSGTWRVFFSGGPQGEAGDTRMRIDRETGTAITPTDNTVYQRELAADDAFTFDTSALTVNKQITFELHLFQPATAVSFTLPSGILWPDAAGLFASANAAPDMSTGGMVYVLVFRWDGSGYLLGNLAYRKEVPSAS